MRYKELPPPSYDENGNKICYVFDTRTNEYIELQEYKSNQAAMRELCNMFEERALSSIGYKITSRTPSKCTINQVKAL